MAEIYGPNGGNAAAYEGMDWEELREIVWPEYPNENRIAYDVRFLRLFGMGADLLLGQLVFWTGKGDDPDGRVHKTKQEIMEQFGLPSVYEVDQARHRLKATGVLEFEKRVRRRKDGSARSPSPVLHYRPKLATLAALLHRYEADPDGTVETLNHRFKSANVEGSDAQNDSVPECELAKVTCSNARGSCG